MGYTHYWYRRKSYPAEKMKAIVNDFLKVLPELEAAKVVIRGPDGTGEPIISEDLVAFNGNALCGHPKIDLGITWPTENAHGVGKPEIAGSWFAGAMLRTRACNGNCSHETFYFPRVMEHDHHIAHGYHFDCCKTAFKPYDLAVQVFLIIAKHHLGDEILITSDGDEQHWIDAQNLVDHVLGYGMEFDLLKERRKVDCLHEGTELWWLAKKALPRQSTLERWCP